MAKRSKGMGVTCREYLGFRPVLILLSPAICSIASRALVLTIIRVSYVIILVCLRTDWFLRSKSLTNNQHHFPVFVFVSSSNLSIYILARIVTGPVFQLNECL